MCVCIRVCIDIDSCMYTYINIFICTHLYKGIFVIFPLTFIFTPVVERIYSYFTSMCRHSLPILLFFC